MMGKKANQLVRGWRLVASLVAVAGLFALAPAYGDGVPWDELSPEQQNLLKGQEENWANLEAQRQERLALAQSVG